MFLVEQFRELHRCGQLLVMPNAWDVGSARLLAHLGFPALATTSGGAAAALGVLDGQLDRGTVLEHCRQLAAAVEVPISGDLEDGLARDPEGVADTIRAARVAGLAGASIEDWADGGFYDLAHATDRVAAAVEAVAGELVITARAENHFRGVDDLDDTIARLQAYQHAGADVAYAPGINTREQIAAVVDALDVPVNVLAVPGTPPLAELAELGVARVSVGASFAFTAYSALADAATELLTIGTYDYTALAARGRALARKAFAAPGAASGATAGDPATT